MLLAGLVVACGSNHATATPLPAPSATSVASPGSIDEVAWASVQLPQVGQSTQIGAVLADDRGFELAGGINDVPAVWASTDGVDWTVDPLPGVEGVTPTRGYLMDGRMVLIGGGGTERCAHPAMAMTWARPTGGDWEIAPFQKILCANPYTFDLVSNGHGMLLVGTGFGEVGLSWASDDGLHWVDTAAPGFRDSMPRAAVWTGTEYVALAVGEPATDVWTSVDGTGWTKAPGGLPGALNTGSMANNGDIVLAVVHGNDDRTLTWQLADDGSWSVIDIPGLDPGIMLRDVRSIDDRFVFLASAAGHPLIVTWRPGDAAVVVGGPQDAVDLIGFAIRDGTLVVLGGVGTIDERHPAAWSAPSSILTGS